MLLAYLVVHLNFVERGRHFLEIIPGPNSHSCLCGWGVVGWRGLHAGAEESSTVRAMIPVFGYGSTISSGHLFSQYVFLKGSALVSPLTDLTVFTEKTNDNPREK